MKKKIVSKVAVFSIATALALPSTVCAAAPNSAPIEVSVKQDGNTHKVFVFGQSLALVSPDGSIEISTIGAAGSVDVMIDGVLTKNVSSIDIPANQQTKMALDENSIIVKNVSAESGKAIKKQINDAYASGAASIDLASLGNVAAYKINADGQAVNADGKAASSNAIGVSVSSTDATSVAFSAEISEIAAQEAAAAAAAADSEIADMAAVSSKKKASDDDEEEISSSSSSSSSSTGGNGTGTGTTTPQQPTPSNPTDPVDPSSQTPAQ